MSELCWLSADQLRRAFLADTLSPTDYIEGLLEHIGHYDPKLHVFLHLDHDSVRQQARAAAKEIRAGDIRSPLHGVPVAIKDIIDVAGVPTTCHSQLMLHQVAAEDAVVVRKLRQAGAIILGKVATWEFALGGPSRDLPFPPANNPWKAGHQPGGSSSGSGAGLAAGLFPLALGTDTGGSIRNPAASCGVVGLKPTYDLVSRRGVFPLAYTLDHVGPMARHVRDAALLLDVIAGGDKSRSTPSSALGDSYSNELGKGIEGLRIGFIRNFHEVDAPAHPEVRQGLNAAVAVLQQCGAQVDEINLPPLNDFSAVHRIILHSEAWSVHKKTLCARPQDYGQISRRRFTSGAFLSGDQYVTAQRRRRQLMAEVNAQLKSFDVLLCANSMDPAGLMDELAGTAPLSTRQSRNPFNLTGHPAISLMSGLSADGLPLSLQLVGRPFDEITLLRVAAAYEDATQFHEQRPPLQAQWS